MGRLFNIFNIYTGLWCVYYLQGILYTSGSIISQGVLALILVISFYYICYAYFYYKLSCYFNVLSLLLIIFTIYGVILLIEGRVFVLNFYDVASNKDYLKAIYMSLFPVYPFYVFTRKGMITEKKLQFWAILFFGKFYNGLLAFL